MPDYEYDVFLSYRRSPLVATWVHQFLKPLLKSWLAQSLPYEPTFFIDTDEIEVGDEWPERLQSALARSRVLLAVLSPDYFRSAWCIPEWNWIRSREKQFNLRDQGRGGIVYALQFSDGEHYPQDVDTIQMQDARPFAYTSAAFKQSDEHLRFELLIRNELAPRVAKLVQQAPPWQAAFDTQIIEPFIATPNPPGVAKAVAVADTSWRKL